MSYCLVYIRKRQFKALMRWFNCRCFQPCIHCFSHIHSDTTSCETVNRSWHAIRRQFEQRLWIRTVDLQILGFRRPVRNTFQSFNSLNIIRTRVKRLWRQDIQWQRWFRYTENAIATIFLSILGPLIEHLTTWTVFYSIQQSVMIWSRPVLLSQWSVYLTKWVRWSSRYYRTMSASLTDRQASNY